MYKYGFRVVTITSHPPQRPGRTSASQGKAPGDKTSEPLPMGLRKPRTITTVVEDPWYRRGPQTGPARGLTCSRGGEIDGWVLPSGVASRDGLLDHHDAGRVSCFVRGNVLGTWARRTRCHCAAGLGEVQSAVRRRDGPNRDERAPRHAVVTRRCRCAGERSRAGPATHDVPD